MPPSPVRFKSSLFLHGGCLEFCFDDGIFVRVNEKQVGPLSHEDVGDLYRYLQLLLSDEFRAVTRCIP